MIESGKTTLKDLYTKEDWMAIWMGFFLLIVGLLIYLPQPPLKMQEIPKHNAVMKEEAAKAPFKTIEWYNASSAKRGVRAKDQAFGKVIEERNLRATAIFYTDFEESADGSEYIRNSLDYKPRPQEGPDIATNRGLSP